MALKKISTSKQKDYHESEVYLAPVCKTDCEKNILLRQSGAAKKQARKKKIFSNKVA